MSMHTRFTCRRPWGWTTLVLLLLAGCQSQPGTDNTPPSSLEEAQRLKASGKYDEALAAARQYLAQQPNGTNCSDALLLAGECEMELTQYDNAQRDFQEAQIKPRNKTISAQAKFGMGQAAFARDEYTDAIRSYEAALQTDTNSLNAPKTLYKLGLSYIRNSNWGEGRRRLREVTEKYAGAPEAELASEILDMRRDVFVLKCDSFSNTAAAQKQISQLQTKGVQARVVPITRSGRTLQSVQTGNYPRYDEARRAGRSLQDQGIASIVFP